MGIQFKDPFKIIIIVIIITTAIIVINHNSRTPELVENIKKIDKQLENEDVRYENITKNNELIRIEYYINETHIATDKIDKKGKIFRRDYYDKKSEEFATTYYDVTGLRVAYTLYFNNETVTIPIVSPISMTSITYH